MLKMTFDLRLNGRSVSARDFAAGLEADIRKAAAEDIERRLRSIRDPKTGAPLRVTRRGFGDRLEWDVQGSPEAVEQANRVLGARR
jgi:hypothetical protein